MKKIIKFLSAVTLAVILSFTSVLPAFAYGETYIVQKGDTLSKIAKATNMTIAELKNTNPMVKDINLIYVGQVLNTTGVDKTLTQKDRDILWAMFDAKYYAANNPDVREKCGINAIALFEHFCEYGLWETRMPNADFNVNAYASAYNDLYMAFGKDVMGYYEHYYNKGKDEGRTLTTIPKLRANNIILVINVSPNKDINGKPLFGTVTAQPEESTPTDTPSTPTDTPSTPTDTPSTPSDTPSTPTDTPSTPTDTPSTPTDTPSIPTDTPSTPTDTPSTPTDTPSTPTDTPSTPSDTPAAPEQSAFDRYMESLFSAMDRNILLLAELMDSKQIPGVDFAAMIQNKPTAGNGTFGDYYMNIISEMNTPTYATYFTNDETSYIKGLMLETQSLVASFMNIQAISDACPDFKAIYDDYKAQMPSEDEYKNKFNEDHDAWEALYNAQDYSFPGAFINGQWYPVNSFYSSDKSPDELFTEAHESWEAQEPNKQTYLDEAMSAALEAHRNAEPQETDFDDISLYDLAYDEWINNAPSEDDFIDSAEEDYQIAYGNWLDDEPKRGYYVKAKYADGESAEAAKAEWLLANPEPDKKYYEKMYDELCETIEGTFMEEFLTLGKYAKEYVSMSSKFSRKK